MNEKETREQQLIWIREKLDRLVHELHELSTRENAIVHHLDALDKQATELGKREIANALRNAHVSLVHASSAFVQAHLNLAMPPTVFEPENAPAETEEAEEDGTRHGA